MSERKINRYILKLSGTADVPKPLKEGHIYTMAYRVDVDDPHYTNNQDGTYNCTYKATPSGEIVIQNEEGKKISTKDKARNSVKTRMALKDIHNNRGLSIDFEDFYTLVTTCGTIPALDHIADTVIKEKDIK